MFADAFIKLDPVQSARIVNLINPKLDIKFDPNKAGVMTHALPFYEGYFLAEISSHDTNPPATRFALCNNDGDVHVLNWTNDVIFKLNKTLPVHLNDDTIMDYVRFFFTYVRGSHGRFLIIDNVDDIDWREEPAPAGRKALSKMIEPMELVKKETDGTNVFRVSIIFRDSLFRAEARVKPDGHIVMSNEELLVEDLPVADDVIGQ